MSPIATLETSEVTVEAGGGVCVPLLLRNDGAIVDEYRFKVVGRLGPWATVEPTRVSVYPGTSATVTVEIQVPRSSDVPAGVIPFGVQVLPTEHPADTTVVEGVVEVGGFCETTAELTPRTSEGKREGRHRVALGNHGNVVLRARLTGKDPDGRLDIAIQPSTLTVVPGRAGFADVTVRPADSLWRGDPQTYPFTVEVGLVHEPSLLLAGAFRQEAQLAPWLLGSFRVFPALFKGSAKLFKALYALLILAVLVAVALGLLFVLGDLDLPDSIRQLLGIPPPDETGIVDPGGENLNGSNNGAQNGSQQLPPEGP